MLAEGGASGDSVEAGRSRGDAWWWCDVVLWQSYATGGGSRGRDSSREEVARPGRNRGRKEEDKRMDEVDERVWDKEKV